MLVPYALRAPAPVNQSVRPMKSFAATLALLGAVLLAYSFTLLPYKNEQAFMQEYLAMRSGQRAYPRSRGATEPERDPRTTDMGGTAQTADLGRAIAAALESGS